MQNFKIISKKEFLKKNKKPDQEKIWGKIAESWKKYVVNSIPIVEEFLENKKGKVIDFGCGTGRNMIPNTKIIYYGVDFSENQLKSAKEYVKKNQIKAKLHKLKIDKLDKKKFKDEMFNYGLFIGSLHCLETAKEREGALKEFYRVLKQNSEALISVWNSEDKRFDHVKNHGEGYISWYKNRIPYMRYYYLYKKSELLRLLSSFGFKLLEFYQPREHDRFSKKNWIIRVRK